jgi:hypothetical protein
MFFNVAHIVRKMMRKCSKKTLKTKRVFAF